MIARTITRRNAYGNKRQKKKLRRFMEQGCGCEYCCPSDRRARVLDRWARRVVRGEAE